MYSLGINSTIGSTVDEDFMKLVEKIPTELKKIQGIAELDPFELSEKFFNSDNVANASIDPNANMGDKSPVSYSSEIFKPQQKYQGYYELWKKDRELFGEDTANSDIESCLNGALYFHDITKYNIPYCFAFDTSFLLTEGRPYGWLTSSEPKRSSSFIGNLVETTMDLSQEHAGAIGIANLLVNLAYFTRKERGELHNAIACVFDTYPEVESEDYNREELIEINIMNALRMYMSGLGVDSSLLDDFLVCDPIEGCSEFNLDKACDMADRVYDKYIQNLLQNFVHVMHNTFRIGGDSPFTNMSIFDKYTFQSVFDTPLYPDLSYVRDNYEEVQHLQKLFVEFFAKGSPITGRNYRFPVVTANIKTWSQEDFEAGLCSEQEVGKISDKEWFDWIVEENRKRGAFNLHAGEKVATCCRLTSDLSALKDSIRVDSFGNGGLSIGSHRVVALNLHRVALEVIFDSSDVEKSLREDFKTNLIKYLQKTKNLLVAHKTILKEMVDKKFLKFFTVGWEDLNMLFSTIGYTGLIDAYSALYGYTIEEITQDPKLTEDYIDFAVETINTMEEYARLFGKENEGFAFNVEEIPGENAAPKMAEADNFLYDSNPDYQHRDLLSNQMVPLYTDLGLFDRLEVSGKLMNLVSGGSILHVNLTEEVTPAAYHELIRLIFEEYKIPHIGVNVGSTHCSAGHTTQGIYKDKCPVCGDTNLDWTMRVVGFQTPVSSWSSARQKDFMKRQFYTAKDVLISE